MTLKSFALVDVDVIREMRDHHVEIAEGYKEFSESPNCSNPTYTKSREEMHNRFIKQLNAFLQEE